MSTATESTLNDIGDSSDPITVDPDAEGFVGTVDDTGDTDDTSSQQTLTGTDSDLGKEEEVPPAPAKGDDTRYDKDPRWQEWKEQRDTAIQKAAVLEAENRILKELGMKPKVPDEPIRPNYRNIMEFTDEDFEAIRDDPSKLKNFAGNLYLQVKDEVLRDFKAEQDKMSTDRSRQEVYTQFEKDNPDFRPLWDKGEIQSFIAKYPPGTHTPMSAYREMTLATRIEAAVKAEADKVRKEEQANFRAKKSATTLGGAGTGVPRASGDEELKDTKASGGIVSTLASRLVAMRKNSS
jgi:hypothetical protein